LRFCLASLYVIVCSRSKRTIGSQSRSGREKSNRIPPSIIDRFPRTAWLGKGRDRERRLDCANAYSRIHRCRLADFCDLAYARVSLNNPSKPVICIVTISAVCIEVTIPGLFALLLNSPAAALSSSALRKEGLSLRA